MESGKSARWGRWYVASTRPRREEFARVMLEQQGLEVFLPMILEWSPGRRRTREKLGHLFPGYLFVRMSGPRDYPKVRWSPGVHRLLGAGGEPEPLEDDLVAEIAGRMGQRGYLVQRPDLHAGDPVEVRHGPFCGLLGVVEAPSTARERVRVLLGLFDRSTSVELEAKHLVRLGHRC